MSVLSNHSGEVRLVMGMVQEEVVVSFSDMERVILLEVLALGRAAMGQALERKDDTLAEKRDKARYENLGYRTREVETVLGVLTFKRRYYRDRETGGFVHLLDEAIGLEERRRSSAGMDVLAVYQGVSGPSYREGAEGLARFYGRSVVSHETVRQRVIRAGEAIASDAKRRQEEASGTREIPVIFIEVDGLYTHMQKHGRSRENRLAVIHEGWEPRSPGSDEYRLKNATFCVVRDGEEPWEEISRHVYSLYRVEGASVVINGDRAAWIRKGTEYFADAARVLYQFDRFHVARDVKRVLTNQKELLKAALGALRESRTRDLLDLLKGAYDREKDSQKAQQIGALYTDLASDEEALRDYRLRLWEDRVDTVGMRGMGAAEANMDKFANRVKKRGQSWSPKGISGMLHALAKSFEGELLAYAHLVAKIGPALDRKALQEDIQRMANRAVEGLAGPRLGHFPATDRGRSATSGLSTFFNRISRPNGIAG